MYAERAFQSNNMLHRLPPKSLTSICGFNFSVFYFSCCHVDCHSYRHDSSRSTKCPSDESACRIRRPATPARPRTRQMSERPRPAGQRKSCRRAVDFTERKSVLPHTLCFPHGEREWASLNFANSFQLHYFRIRSNLERRCVSPAFNNSVCWKPSWQETPIAG